jgi:hypothetical protein
VRHLAPTAGQIEVRYSKHIIGCLSGATAALVGPFADIRQHGSAPLLSLTPLL